MNWLTANWYGVFAAPALIGIGCWVVAHRVISDSDRHYREREARKRGGLGTARAGRRRR
jgi:hypothetical protein